MILVFACLHPRQDIVLALVAILTVFSFEIGVHSTHHVDGRDRLTSCAVGAATGHLAGASVGKTTTDCLAFASSRLAAVDGDWLLNVRPLCIHQGRAPPLGA